MPRALCLRRRSRPTFEPLEGRALLAALMVTNTLDSGSGSLRQAVLDADAASGASTIGFAIPGQPMQGAYTISPATDLPAITRPVTIDGTTEAGYAGSPVVAIDGTDQKVSTGLEFDYGSSGSVIEGLAIDAFAFAGVLVVGPQVTVESSRIGLTPGGLIAGSGMGIDLLGGNNSPSGDPAAGPGSVVSGNIIAGNGDGIDLSGAVNASVTGNFIGTDSTGRADLGNTRNGIIISGTTVGTAISDNTISDNGRAAIEDDSGGTGVALSGDVEANNGLLNANLAVTSSVTAPLNDPIAAATGQVETITYTVTNDGPAAATGASLTLASSFAQASFDLQGLPSPVFKYLGAVVSQGTVAPGYIASSERADFGTIAPGGSASVTIALHVVGSGRDTILATATSQAPTTVPPGPAIRTEIMATGHADLSVTALPPPPARVGQPETFTFVVTNNDPLYSTDALIALSLGSGVSSPDSLGVISSQGTVYALLASGRFAGDLGVLGPGASAVVTAVIIPPARGPISSGLYAYSAYDPDPAPGNNLAVAASLATSAPSLLGATLLPTSGAISAVAVSFDAPLNASQAQNAGNYRLTIAGSNSRIAIKSATYNASPHVVTLRLSKSLPRQGAALRLVAGGPGTPGLAGPDGSKLLNAGASFPLTRG